MLGRKGCTPGYTRLAQGCSRACPVAVLHSDRRCWPNTRCAQVPQAASRVRINACVCVGSPLLPWKEFTHSGELQPLQDAFDRTRVRLKSSASSAVGCVGRCRTSLADGGLRTIGGTAGSGMAWCERFVFSASALLNHRFLLPWLKDRRLESRAAPSHAFCQDEKLCTLASAQTAAARTQRGDASSAGSVAPTRVYFVRHLTPTYSKMWHLAHAACIAAWVDWLPCTSFCVCDERLQLLLKPLFHKRRISRTPGGRQLPASQSSGAQMQVTAQVHIMLIPMTSITAQTRRDAYVVPGTYTVHCTSLALDGLFRVRFHATAYAHATLLPFQHLQSAITC